MSTLNIVNKSPFEKRTLEQCLGRIAPTDSILLIEDACVSAIEGTQIESRLLDFAQRGGLFVLQPDLEARGFAQATLLQPVKTVDYNGFVQLVVEHDRVHSWL